VQVELGLDRDPHRLIIHPSPPIGTNPYVRS
jgi:hypothetical protein